MKDVETALMNVRTNASKLGKQAPNTVKVLENIEKLKMSQDEAKSALDKDAEQLESLMGVGWSREVFDELDWRLEDARSELINLAQ